MKYFIGTGGVQRLVADVRAAADAMVSAAFGASTAADESEDEDHFVELSRKYGAHMCAKVHAWMCDVWGLCIVSAFSATLYGALSKVRGAVWGVHMRAIVLDWIWCVLVLVRVRV